MSSSFSCNDDGVPLQAQRVCREGINIEFIERQLLERFRLNKGLEGQLENLLRACSIVQL